MSRERDQRRVVLPIPERTRPATAMTDANDPDAVFPKIAPVRPPSGAPNVLVVLLDDVGFGESVGSGRVDATVPGTFSADETTDIGTDNATGVTDDLDRQSVTFTGTVSWVQIDLGDAAEDFDHLVTAEERFRIAMARQ